MEMSTSLSLVLKVFFIKRIAFKTPLPPNPFFTIPDQFQGFYKIEDLVLKQRQQTMNHSRRILAEYLL